MRLQPKFRKSSIIGFLAGKEFFAQIEINVTFYVRSNSAFIVHVWICGCIYRYVTVNVYNQVMCI